MDPIKIWTFKNETLICRARPIQLVTQTTSTGLEMGTATVRRITRDAFSTAAIAAPRWRRGGRPPSLAAASASASNSELLFKLSHSWPLYSSFRSFVHFNYLRVWCGNNNYTFKLIIASSISVKAFIVVKFSLFFNKLFSFQLIRFIT